MTTICSATCMATTTQKYPLATFTTMTATWSQDTTSINRHIDVQSRFTLYGGTLQQNLIRQRFDTSASSRDDPYPGTFPTKSHQTTQSNPTRERHDNAARRQEKLHELTKVQDKEGSDKGGSDDEEGPSVHSSPRYSGSTRTYLQEHVVKTLPVNQSTQEPAAGHGEAVFLRVRKAASDREDWPVDIHHLREPLNSNASIYQTFICLALV
jgi:hypothetical protein